MNFDYWIEEDFDRQTGEEKPVCNNDETRFNCWIFRENGQYYMTDTKVKIRCNFKPNPKRDNIFKKEKLTKRIERYMVVHLDDFEIKSNEMQINFSIDTKKLNELKFHSVIAEVKFQDDGHAVVVDVNRPRTRLSCMAANILKPKPKVLTSPLKTIEQLDKKKNESNKNDNLDKCENNLSQLVKELSEDNESLLNHTIEIIKKKDPSTKTVKEKPVFKTISSKNLNLNDGFYDSQALNGSSNNSDKENLTENELILIDEDVDLFNKQLESASKDVSSSMSMKLSSQLVGMSASVSSHLLPLDISAIKQDSLKQTVKKPLDKSKSNIKMASSNYKDKGTISINPIIPVVDLITSDEDEENNSFFKSPQLIKKQEILSPGPSSPISMKLSTQLDSVSSVVPLAPFDISIIKSDLSRETRINSQNNIETIKSTSSIKITLVNDTNNTEKLINNLISSDHKNSYTQITEKNQVNICESKSEQEVNQNIRIIKNNNKLERNINVVSVNDYKTNSHYSRAFSRRESNISSHSSSSQANYENMLDNLFSTNNNSNQMTNKLKRKRKLMEKLNKASDQFLGVQPHQTGNLSSLNIVNNNNNNNNNNNDNNGNNNNNNYNVNDNLNTDATSSNNYSNPLFNSSPQSLRSRSSSSSSTITTLSSSLSSSDRSSIMSNLTDVCSKSLLFAPKSFYLYKEKLFKRSLSAKKSFSYQKQNKQRACNSNTNSPIHKIFSPRIKNQLTSCTLSSTNRHVRNQLFVDKNKQQQNKSAASTICNASTNTKDLTRLNSNVLDQIISLNNFDKSKSELKANLNENKNNNQNKIKRKKLFNPNTFNIDNIFEPLSVINILDQNENLTLDQSFSNTPKKDSVNNDSKKSINDLQEGSELLTRKNNSFIMAMTATSVSDKSIPSGQNPENNKNVPLSNHVNSNSSKSIDSNDLGSICSNNSNNSKSSSDQANQLMDFNFSLKPDTLQDYLIESRNLVDYIEIID